VNISKTVLSAVLGAAVIFSGWVAWQFIDMRDRLTKIEVRLDFISPKEARR
jgi:hypothetical protein